MSENKSAIPPQFNPGSSGKSSSNEVVAALDTDAFPTYIYPQNLDEIDHWMSIRVHKHQFRPEGDREIESAICGIFLPLPANLQTQYDHTYNVEGVGPAGTAIGKAAIGAINKMGSTASIKEGLKVAIDSVSGKGLSQATQYYALEALRENATDIGAGIGGLLGGGAIGGVAGGIAGAIAESSVKAALAEAGIAKNPFMATMYDSPSMRAHTFEWKMIPRNYKESKTLFQIIGALKYFSAPGLTRNVFFSYPEQFDIDFHYGKTLFNIGPSVCTSISVNYHSEGRPLYFDVSDPEAAADEAQTLKYPVSVTLSANFQEVRLVTKETIKDYNR